MKNKDKPKDKLINELAELRQRLTELEAAEIERRRAEEELRKPKGSAEVANRAKSDYLARISHELRTQLNVIIGFSEVLQDQYFGKLNKKQSEYVKDILESGKHLLTLGVLFLFL